jgi:hypothetical protein
MDNSPEILQYKLQTIFDSTGSKEAASEFQKVMDSARKAGEEQVKQDEKAFVSKKDLRGMVKGLRDEFPLLAHIGRLAINPIALLVSGVAAGFAIWRSKVQECEEALTAMVLPELSEAKVGEVKAMAKAYSDFADALQKSVEGYSSVEKASERAGKQVDAELERNKKLIESQKNLALAKLEADKANLKPGEYEQRKAEIEDAFEKRGVKAEREGKLKKLGLKAEEEDKLAADAQAKLKEAAKIKLGTAEEDAQTEAELKAESDEAKKGQTAARKRMADYSAMRDVGMPSFKDFGTAFSLYAQGGFKAVMNPSEQIAQQQQNIAEAQIPIDRYRRFRAQKDARERGRKRRGELVETAGKEAGEAEAIHHDLWDKGGSLDQFDADQANQGAVSRNAALAGAYKASGQVKDKEHEVLESIRRSAEDGTKIRAETLKMLNDLHAADKDFEQRIKSMENSRKLAPPGT